METINDRFRFAREKMGLSQEEFATRANRTRSEIKNIEYGKTAPKPEVIMAICKAHGIDDVWLRTGVGEMHRRESREEAVAAVLGSAISGNSTARDRLVRALARLPDDAFPLIEKFILDSAALLQEDAPKG